MEHLAASGIQLTEYRAAAASKSLNHNGNYSGILSARTEGAARILFLTRFVQNALALSAFSFNIHQWFQLFPESQVLPLPTPTFPPLTLCPSPSAFFSPKLHSAARTATTSAEASAPAISSNSSTLQSTNEFLKSILSKTPYVAVLGAAP